ncbi:polysaccharide pyruvyl transferase family protein [Simiduia agarivorans]|uniref:Response regulator receiver domain-containing protein n=1 Tax=Simiduia agarivorans (strain DSM 21679 / JCM 13881 / BCRC 17597 / SA1) TaxID=1117647 RepID=K4KLB5_SIMAS|nr:polysaccharide pyruvyl transferase family protein [Simiduia agarivorans]AFU99806.1 response regulator receiver domain-containing protein [Simiduia agarivorans SA1 = DSM 21679]
MQSLYLSGYYGMKNSGDDALMLAAAMGARQFLNVQDLVVGSFSPVLLPEIDYRPAALREPQRIRGENRIRNYFHAVGCDAVLFGGGSVFHTAQDINVKRHMARLSGVAFALGVGVGPFRDTAAERACQAYLRAGHRIRVRDQVSYEIATALAPEADIGLSFDLAPLLLTHPAANLIEPAKRQGICVCLCPRERLQGNAMAEAKRIRALATALNRVAAETGEKVTLLDFNGHPELGDHAVHRELAALLSPGVLASHIAYNGDPLRVLQSLSHFKVIIGMRLHAAILGFMAQTPVLALNYHSKSEGWCEQIGLARNLQFSCGKASEAQHSAEDIQAMTTALIDGLSQGFQPPVMNRDEALQKSLLNWR